MLDRFSRVLDETLTRGHKWSRHRHARFALSFASMPSLTLMIFLAVANSASAQLSRGSVEPIAPSDTEALLRIQADRIWGRFLNCGKSSTDKPAKISFVGLPKDNLRVSEPVRQSINAILLRGIGGSQMRAVPLDYLGNILQLTNPNDHSTAEFKATQERVAKFAFHAEAKTTLRTPQIIHIQIRLLDRRPGCEDEDPIDLVLSLPVLKVTPVASARDRDHVVLEGFLFIGAQAVAALVRRTTGSFKAILPKTQLAFEGSCIFGQEIQSRLEGHYDAKRYEVGLLSETEILPPLSALQIDDIANLDTNIAVLRQTYRLRDRKNGTLSATLELIHAGLKHTTLHRLVVVPPSELEGCDNATPAAPASVDVVQPEGGTPERPQPHSTSPAARDDARNPGQPEFVSICPQCPRMIRVRGPQAAMAAASKTRGAKSEGRITLSDFLVSEAEITRLQFEAFVSAAGYRPTTTQEGRTRGCLAPVGNTNDWSPSRTRTYASPGFQQGPDHPVVCVSWYDAEAYTRWLGQKTGRSVRLLSELEHALVNRAGQNGRYWWGDVADGSAAHYETGPGMSSAGVRATIPSRALRANPWGFLHITGNAAEWVADCWNEAVPPQASDDLAPLTSGDCSRRVIKGGGWTYQPKDIAIDARDHSPAQHAFVDVGFRVAADLE